MIHKNMDVWKLSMDFVTNIYGITVKFPAEERFGLAQQMRRAAVSIPSNIAEGAARKSPNEFVQFLHIALGSLAELETQMILCERLGFNKIDLSTDYDNLNRIRKMLIGLIRYKKG
ncbi:MAG: four helix bundle protein [Bacteroidia bacterium]|nr:four helix bundle protein [Bacteroidia bacterium]